MSIQRSWNFKFGEARQVINSITRHDQALRFYRVALFLLLILISICCSIGRAEGTGVPAMTGRIEETNSMELRTYLQLQEQLHATQMAIERTRKDSEAAAAQNMEALGARLQTIEQALSAQRARELQAMQNSNQAMQSSNQVMLIVAGAFAIIGLVAMSLMGYFQWRTVNRLAEISASLPVAGLALGPPRPIAAIGPSTAEVVATTPIERPNGALLEAVERLEKRILEMENASHASLKNGDFAAKENATSLAPEAGPGENGNSSPAAQITLLLGKGQSLLSMDKAEDALACFDEVLALDAHNPEALVKKGTALERLRKLNEAIECYDRAIEADGSMTIAYLYKGGLFNRMERFSEALECYEQALRTQETRRAALS